MSANFERSGSAAALALCTVIAACDYTDEMTPRSYASLLVADTLAVRQRIAQEVVAGRTDSIAGPLTLAPSRPDAVTIPIDFGWVTREGALVTHSKKYGVTVVQEPVILNGAVKWSCVVHPADARPNVCGDQ